jgi:hypothetical protein
VASIATPFGRLMLPDRLRPAERRDRRRRSGRTGVRGCAGGRGIVATVYDANDRTGGPMLDAARVLPGQVAERGGEFIDTPHKTMLRFAKRFGLALEDVTKKAGETTYFFNGHDVPEAP